MLAINRAMKNGSRDDASPLRHVCSHVRTDDVIVDVSSPLGAETREIVERGRTRNMVSKFELAGGSKVNMCGSGSRSFASGSHVENMQKVNIGLHIVLLQTTEKPDLQTIFVRVLRCN